MVFTVYTRLMVNKSWPPPGCMHHCRSWRRSWHLAVAAEEVDPNRTRLYYRKHNADRKSGHAARITHCKVLQDSMLQCGRAPMVLDCVFQVCCMM